MVEASSRDTQDILAYLKPNVHDCIYMYIDIKKYGLDDSGIKVWVDKDKDGKINLVVLRYHTSMTIYSDQTDYDLDGVIALIKDNKPLSITAKRSIIEQLTDTIDGNYSDVFYGYVMEFTNYPDFKCENLVETAEEKDAYEIAELVTSDHEIGSYYDVQDLANQFIERMKDHMGRNLIIRENGKIVGHIATYAELDNIATSSGLIVDPQYQGKLYGAVLEGYLMRLLHSEGFHVYAFLNERRMKQLKRMGNSVLGEYGKLTFSYE